MDPRLAFLAVSGDHGNFRKGEKCFLLAFLDGFTSSSERHGITAEVWPESIKQARLGRTESLGTPDKARALI